MKGQGDLGLKFKLYFFLYGSYRSIALMQSVPCSNIHVKAISIGWCFYLHLYPFLDQGHCFYGINKLDDVDQLFFSKSGKVFEVLTSKKRRFRKLQLPTCQFERYFLFLNYLVFHNHFQVCQLKCRKLFIVFVRLGLFSSRQNYLFIRNLTA